MKFINKKADPENFEHLYVEFFKSYKDVVMPPEFSYLLKDNLMRLLLQLARYKFAARVLRPSDSVLEVGCGMGMGTLFLGQNCRSVKGIDSNARNISEAKNTGFCKNVSFETADFFKYPKTKKYDAVVSIDVIEHMLEASARRFLSKTAELIDKNGMLILGTPSRYAYKYQGVLSQAGHLKLYDQDELVKLTQKYYGRVLAFSMNDELVHTGFSKMSWYYFILAFCPKKK